jgi:uncharacterized Tic20 family protein
MTSENSRLDDSLARSFWTAEAPLKPAERVPAALAHLLSLPPLWGVLFAAGIAHYYRESSRSVAFQARQAVYAQLAFLSLGVACILIRLAAQLLEAAFPGHGLGLAAAWFGHPKAVALYIAFCACAVLAATLTSLGHNIAYPFLGRRLWETPAPDDAGGLYG